MDAIQEALFSALGTIFIALVGWLTTKIVGYLNDLKVTEKLSNKQYLVDIAVNAVEQIWKNENGSTKLTLAKEEALDLMNKNGFKITTEELNTLVEASVKAMNDAANKVKNSAIDFKDGE